MPGTDGNVEVFVNHEQSRVPFNGSATSTPSRT